MDNLKTMFNNCTTNYTDSNRDLLVLPDPRPHQTPKLLQEIVELLFPNKKPTHLNFSASNTMTRRYYGLEFFQNLPTIGRYAVSASNNWNHNDLQECRRSQKLYSTRREIAFHLKFQDEKIALIFTPSMKSANLITFKPNPDYTQIISTFPDSVHSAGWTRSANEIVKRIQQYVDYNQIITKL